MIDEARLTELEDAVRHVRGPVQPFPSGPCSRTDTLVAALAGEAAQRATADLLALSVVPDLVAEVRRQRALLADARKLLEPVEWLAGQTPCSRATRTGGCPVHGRQLAQYAVAGYLLAAAARFVPNAGEPDAWKPAHMPAIGGGGCDPACAAQPPHVIAPLTDEQALAQMALLREKGRITLTEYQRTGVPPSPKKGWKHLFKRGETLHIDIDPVTPACGVGPLDLSSPRSKLKTIHDLHAKTCEDAECLVCGVLSCPMGEPMHFAHDGCPACLESNDEST